MGKNITLSWQDVPLDVFLSSLSETTQQQLSNLVADYERTIERIKTDLENIGENSIQREVYLRRISIYEKKSKRSKTNFRELYNSSKIGERGTAFKRHTTR